MREDVLDELGNVGVVTPEVSTTLNLKYKFEPSEQTRQATWSDTFCRNVGARIIVVVLCALKRRGYVCVCQASAVKEQEPSQEGEEPCEEREESNQVRRENKIHLSGTERLRL